MRILMLGDVYGRTGRRLIAAGVPYLRREWRADWVIVNGENATGGAGISPRHRNGLLEKGVDLLTTGNHLFARTDWPDLMKDGGRLLRPHNLGGDNLPGRGWQLLEGPGRSSLGVINLAGRVFMEPADCPFQWADRLLARLPAGVPVVVDFHAEATSEKIAMAWHLDGRAALVAGTHTHVQTADDRVLPGGTAAITDLGLTGPRFGVLGVDRETVLKRFRHGYSEKFLSAGGLGALEGVFLSLGADGKCDGFKRFHLAQEDLPPGSLAPDSAEE